MSPEYVRPYVKAQKNDDRDAEGIVEAATMRLAHPPVVQIFLSPDFDVCAVLAPLLSIVVFFVRMLARSQHAPVNQKLPACARGLSAV